MKKIKVFAAGVAGKLAKATAARFESENKGSVCELEIGGSTGGVCKLLDGEKYDVMILADNANIDQMMMPEYADGYFIWGGNEMAVIGKGITTENWQEKLLAPESKVKHVNPFNDPGGYRAVMAMQLADHVKPGLAKQLLEHPNYKGCDRAEYQGPRMPPKEEEGVYRIGYKSMAVANGMDYAALPVEMNLGDPSYEELYNTVSFDVDGGKTVYGNTILHAIVIPKNAKNPEGGVEYARLFLANRFVFNGFTPVQKKVGRWDIKPANMWDSEARYYSLMTLMEVNGTNMQLDCMPLDKEDVVLDCGCGPGRIAIQAAKRVKKVICLDNSEGMLEECKKNCAAAGVTNVEFVLADWQETEIGITIPEVDVVIQSRGGGGASTLNMLKKAARKYAVTVIWADGAPCLPESRNKLFVDCYNAEALEKHPELKPMNRPKMPPMAADAGSPVVTADTPLPAGRRLKGALTPLGIDVNVTTIDEGWDRLFKTRQDAYDWLIQLSRYPELVNVKKFRENVDSFLTETAEGFYFFLPTSSDITYFKTR
ncbi:MAG: methyltransferase domain-containing protein [Oscillospiraceae bacterium]|nr:methyltransferase domain-containing protein [Oscillospiraceae bacterium]